jgi:hypothetical protein
MIIWIPSYPKSGNTWIRAFLSTYLYSPDGTFKYNLINKIGEFPDHNILNKFMNSKDFHNLGEVSKHWIGVQQIINHNKRNIFLKTHGSLCNINGKVFTNSANTLVFIYIVRDPRNVITSMSNHFGTSQEECFKTIINEKYIIYPEMNNQIYPATLVGSWNVNYKSWKNFGSVNKIIIRYEDLISNTEDTLKKIINFLSQHTDVKYNKDKLTEAMKNTNFANLKKYEEEFGFNMGQKGKFFYLGKENNWKKLLDPAIDDKITELFKSEMSELGYI